MVLKQESSFELTAPFIAAPSTIFSGDYFDSNMQFFFR
jgi:hypothetical protein